MENANPTPPVRRLERGDGPIGGVAAGLADYFNVDVTLIRLGLAAGTLLGGPVVPICYLAAWAIIPRRDQVPIVPLEGQAPPPPVPAASPAPAPVVDPPPAEAAEAGEANDQAGEPTDSEVAG